MVINKFSSLRVLAVKSVFSAKDGAAFEDGAVDNRREDGPSKQDYADLVVSECNDCVNEYSGVVDKAVAYVTQNDPKKNIDWHISVVMTLKTLMAEFMPKVGAYTTAEELAVDVAKRSVVLAEELIRYGCIRAAIRKEELLSCYAALKAEHRPDRVDELLAKVGG